MLQSMRLQGVGCDLATEQVQQACFDEQILILVWSHFFLFFFAFMVTAF